MIGLIIFYATRYTRKAFSKSFATTVEHDAPYTFTDVKKSEIDDKKAPLLNIQDRLVEVDSPGGTIFPGSQQQNDVSDDDDVSERNDYDDEDDDNVTGPLSAPSDKHHVTNDQKDNFETRSQHLFDDEPTL